MDDKNRPSSATPPAAPPTTATRLVRRSRVPGPGWIWSAGAVVLLVALVSVLTQMALARGEARQTAAATRAVATAQAAQAPQHIETLATVAMTSPADGWAFGMIGEAVYGPYPRQGTPKVGCQICTLILHYDGHTWSRVPTDPSLDIPVVSVAMLSPSDGWAVGGNGILHYSGGAWTLAARIDTGQQHGVGLLGISMVSASEGWAVGFDDDYATGEHPLLLHYTGGAWSPVHLPIFDQPRVELKSIAMLPSGEGWAVGGEYADSGQQTIVLHYSHGSWTPQETGVPAQLNSVVALSPSEAWAVGTKDIAVGPGVILHYIGGTWRSIASPTPNVLHTVVMRSATDGWIGGDGAAILRYNGRVWTKADLVIHGYQLTSLAIAGSGATVEGWGVGSYQGSSADGPLMLRYSNGA